MDFRPVERIPQISSIGTGDVEPDSLTCAFHVRRVKVGTHKARRKTLHFE
jgi:hypothetical protein